jgi:hypothetical protein
MRVMLSQTKVYVTYTHKLIDNRQRVYCPPALLSLSPEGYKLIVKEPSGVEYTVPVGR